MWSQTPERAPPRTTGPRLDEQSAPMNPPRASFLTPSLNSEVNDPKSHNRFQVQCNPCHGLRTHVRLHLLLKLVAPLMQQSCSWVVLMLTWRRHSIARSQCLSHAACPLKCPLARLCSRLQRVKLGSQQPLEATPYTSGFWESAMH